MRKLTKGLPGRAHAGGGGLEKAKIDVCSTFVKRYEDIGTVDASFSRPFLCNDHLVARLPRGGVVCKQAILMAKA